MEYYREKIIEIVNSIENAKTLALIYGFVDELAKEEECKEE